MILNHNHIPVWEWNGESPSLCPECDAELLARRGDFMVWHWAHFPRPSGQDICRWEESAWHLSWKYAYLSFKNWQIEAPVCVSIGDSVQKYRIDALNPITGNAREFIHSLSPQYRVKHRNLCSLGYDVLWVFDGSVFVSAKHKFTRCRRGAKRFLKPIAHQMYVELGNCIVHWDGAIWKEWRNNVFYRIETPTTRALLHRFDRATVCYRDRKHVSCEPRALVL